MRKAVFWTSILVFCCSAGLLITGSDLLMLAVLESANLPLGTITTWLGLIALPATIISGNKSLWDKTNHGRIYGYLLRACLLFSACWGVISYTLSGKWNFTFRGDSPTFQGSAEAGEYFWMITYGMVALPIILGLAFAIHSAILKRVN